jgi:hypothetical protein
MENGWLTMTAPTGLQVIVALACFISSRRAQLGLLGVTWFLCCQTHINLSWVNIGSKICNLMKEILRPMGLEPMEDFCAQSLIWGSTIFGLAIAGQIFTCSWVYLKAEFRLFWIELQD